DGRGKGEVEEQDEVAPRGRIQRRRGTNGLGLEIDGLEVGDGALRPPIEQLEIRRRQSAHRIARAVDDRDRHLDEMNVNGFLDLCRCSACCEQNEEHNAAEAAHRNDFLPDTERTECAKWPNHAVTSLTRTQTA